jgi:hypothetical protein
MFFMINLLNQNGWKFYSELVLKQCALHKNLNTRNYLYELFYFNSS